MSYGKLQFVYWLVLFILFEPLKSKDFLLQRLGLHFDALVLRTCICWLASGRRYGSFNQVFTTFWVFKITESSEFSANCELRDLFTQRKDKKSVRIYRLMSELNREKTICSIWCFSVLFTANEYRVISYSHSLQLLQSAEISLIWIILNACKLA